MNNLDSRKKLSESMKRVYKNKSIWRTQIEKRKSIAEQYFDGESERLGNRSAKPPYVGSIPTQNSLHKFFFMLKLNYEKQRKIIQNQLHY